MNQIESYDVVISGGGVAGCLAALAIVLQSNYKVLLLEANPQADSNKHAGFDARVIALAAESLTKLKALGVDVDSIPACAIKHIHVSDRHHVGQVRLSSCDFNIPELGRVVSIDTLGSHLFNQLQSFSKDRFNYYCPAKIDAVEQAQDNVTLHLSNSKTVQSKLLIICDGTNSSTATKLKLSSNIQDYEQCAIITNVKTQRPHNQVAYERFTSQGPVAFLPMVDDCDSDANSFNHTMSVVWCMHTSKVESILALEQDEFLVQLGGLFTDKLGKLLSCSKRYSYPLIKQALQSFTSHRVVCLANSAQSLHPIAGQGFNLGIRDVYDLLLSIKGNDDPGSFKVITQYESLRRQDKQRTLEFTDSLVRIFSNQYEPLVCGRNLALSGMNFVSSFKNKFAEFSMGKRKQASIRRFER